MNCNIEEVIKLNDEQLRFSMANISPINRRIFVKWIIDNGYNQFAEKVATVIAEIEINMLRFFYECLLNENLRELLSVLSLVDFYNFIELIKISEDIKDELKEYYIMLIQDAYKDVLEGVDYVNDYELYDYWREDRCPLFTSRVYKNNNGLKM